MRAGLMSVLAACTAGEPEIEPTDNDVPVDTGAPVGDAAFRFEPITVEGIAPRWGAAAVGRYVVSGMDAAMQVSTDVFSLDATDGTVHASLVATLDVPRYCSCALFDPGRNELLVLGGRDDRYADATTAELVDLTTGSVTPVDDAGAADHPVGCHAFFSPARDRGWIFGGLASSSGFTDQTWRYDPVDHTFTELDTDGPFQR